MPNIAKHITDLIGNTPLLELERFSRSFGISARLLAKLEYYNPAGSVKDRIALAMLNDAEERGILSPGGVVIEPTSGNTGIGLAAVGASRGYRVILTMPDTMSIERRKLLCAYGAELVLTDGALGMDGAITKAKELAAQIPGAFLPGQFDNIANAQAHLDTTGPEIWRDTGGNVDIFIAGAGTGGSITGIGRYLKSQKHDIKVVAVEPYESSVLSGFPAGPHKVQGIGAGFVPGVLDLSVIDEIIRIKSNDSIELCRKLAVTEGLLVGVSSGAALKAAIAVALRPENTEKTIIVLFPDSGERYLSVAGFVMGDR